MEPRNDELKKVADPPKEKKPRRFKIEKLEERIAPCNPHINPQGKYVGLGCYYHHHYHYR